MVLPLTVQGLRLTSFLHTTYFDSDFRTKPRYELPAIELVAEAGGIIAGAIDVECDEAPGSVCTACGEGQSLRIILRNASTVDRIVRQESERGRAPHGIPRRGRLSSAQSW